VLEDALNRIEPDGTVRVYDYIYDEWGTDEPWEPVNLQKLTECQYNNELYHVARNIAVRCRDRGKNPPAEEHEMGILASFLTAYRHDPQFLDQAISLITTRNKLCSFSSPAIKLENDKMRLK
jgi:hypothetical protein